MIAKIIGTIDSTTTDSCIIDTAGGVGYEVFCPQSDLQELIETQNATLYCYHHITESSQRLFGFIQQSSVTLFKLVVSVSGIGPKTALGILNLGSIQTIAQEILNGNDVFLAQASGLGKKTASKLVLELKDKISKYPELFGSAGVTPGNSALNELFSALEALGYHRDQIRKVVDKIDSSQTIEDQIRNALQSLHG